MRQAFLSLIPLLLLLTGCFSTAEKASDDKLYEKMNNTINTNPSKANEYLVSLMVEYPNSPFIQPALLTMIEKHINDKTFNIAQFYLKKYKERFLTPYNRDYLNYLELSILYHNIKGEKREQLKVKELMEKHKQFLERFSDSAYRYHISTMYAHLYLLDWLNNENIADLYEDLDKPHAALIYRQKIGDKTTSLSLRGTLYLLKKIYFKK